MYRFLKCYSSGNIDLNYFRFSNCQRISGPCLNTCQVSPRVHFPQRLPDHGAAGRARPSRGRGGPSAGTRLCSPPPPPPPAGSLSLARPAILGTGAGRGRLTRYLPAGDPRFLVVRKQASTISNSEVLENRGGSLGKQTTPRERLCGHKALRRRKSKQIRLPQSNNHTAEECD